MLRAILQELQVHISQILLTTVSFGTLYISGRRNTVLTSFYFFINCTKNKNKKYGRACSYIRCTGCQRSLVLLIFILDKRKVFLCKFYGYQLYFPRKYYHLYRVFHFFWGLLNFIFYNETSCILLRLWVPR